MRVPSTQGLYQMQILCRQGPNSGELIYLLIQIVFFAHSLIIQFYDIQ